MYMSVVVSVIFGFILLVAVTAALPAEPVFDLYIVPSSWVAAMGESWGTSILFVAVVAQLFCLIASVTSASVRIWVDERITLLKFGSAAPLGPPAAMIASEMSRSAGTW